MVQWRQWPLSEILKSGETSSGHVSFTVLRKNKEIIVNIREGIEFVLFICESQTTYSILQCRYNYTKKHRCDHTLYILLYFI